MPHGIVLRSHIKFHPQQTPSTSVAGSGHLLEDSKISPGTATFSPDQLTLFSSTCEMGKQSIFAFNVLSFRWNINKCVTYSMVGAESLQNIKTIEIPIS